MGAAPDRATSEGGGGARTTWIAEVGLPFVPTNGTNFVERDPTNVITWTPEDGDFLEPAEENCGTPCDQQIGDQCVRTQGSKRHERSPTSSTEGPPLKSAATEQYPEGGDPQEHAFGTPTESSEGEPPPPYTDTHMYEEHDYEWWNEEEKWEFWRETVENRFNEVHANIDRFEAALFGAAGIEPVVMSSLNQGIENALEQYNMNMQIEMESMQAHFARMKMESDNEIRSMFG